MTEPQIEAPRSFNKAQKAAFERVVDARKALGKPITSTELNLVVDLSLCRWRLDLLHRELKKESRNYGGAGSLQTHRVIDVTTRTARRLSRDLGL